MIKNFEVSWWIKGGADLRTVEGKDIITHEGELTKSSANQILEDSLEGTYLSFSEEHYMIECGVWDFGVSQVVSLGELQKIIDTEKQREEEYWKSLWDRAKYMQTTGMPLSYLKREKICPDCGGEIMVLNDIMHHQYYRCYECDAMFADKGAGQWFKCREW